jgi:hypothetical protein
MSEEIKIEKPRAARTRKVAAYLAPLAAAGALVGGWGKLVENATELPRQLPVAADIKPAHPVPGPNFNKVYEAHQGETAADIISEAYPNLETDTKQYEKVRNMVNNQISEFDEFNREHPAERMVPVGQTEPIQLTKSAEIPMERTEAYYIGDYKMAKKIGSSP